MVIDELVQEEVDQLRDCVQLDEAGTPAANVIKLARAMGDVAKEIQSAAKSNPADVDGLLGEMSGLIKKAEGYSRSL